MDDERSAGVVLPVTGLTPYLRLHIATNDDAVTVEDGRSFLSSCRCRGGGSRSRSVR